MQIGLSLSVPALALRLRGGIYAAYLAATDFDNKSYAQRAGNTIGSAQTTYAAPSSLAGYTFAAAGACYELNSDGSIAGPFAENIPAITDQGFKARQAFTNLLLNAGSSTTLATQTTPALTAVPHTIAFIGTGSVSLSGSYTGSLAGTGNRVSLTFTPTAAALTITVTGDVRFATLYAAATAGPIITTAGAAATRGEALLAHNLFADGSALTDQDMLIWVDATASEITGTQTFANIYISANEQIRLQLVSGLLTAIVTVAGVDVYSQSVAGAIAANAAFKGALRRSGGSWRVSKYVGTALTSGTEAAGTFPTGMTKAYIGNVAAGGAPLRGTIDSAFIRPGTFSTDADIIAALTGAP